MKYKQHIIFSITLASIVLIIFKPKNILLYYLFSVIGGLFPDVDIKNSKINKIKRKSIVLGGLISILEALIYKPIKIIKPEKYKHRGFTHSIIPCTISSLIVFIIFYTFFSEEVAIDVSLGFFIGYISHIILDFYL